MRSTLCADTFFSSVSSADVTGCGGGGGGHDRLRTSVRTAAVADGGRRALWGACFDIEHTAAAARALASGAARNALTLAARNDRQRPRGAAGTLGA